MSFRCLLCKKGEPLYKCPECGAAAHINKKQKTVTIHFQPLNRSNINPKGPPISVCFPSHFGCELGKPVDQIDLTKLVKVKQK